MNEAQQQKEKEKLEYLSHIIATIYLSRLRISQGWQQNDITGEGK
jgi:hypothetical protein